MYAYRNSIGNFYSSPFFCGDGPEVTGEKFSHMLFAADEKQLDSLIDDELYYIGEFDDHTGLVTPVNEFVVNMGALVRQVKQARAIKDDDDGKEKES